MLFGIHAWLYSCAATAAAHGGTEGRVLQSLHRQERLVQTGRRGVHRQRNEIQSLQFGRHWTLWVHSHGKFSSIRPSLNSEFIRTVSSLQLYRHWTVWVHSHGKFSSTRPSLNSEFICTVSSLQLGRHWTLWVHSHGKFSSIWPSLNSLSSFAR